MNLDRFCENLDKQARRLGRTERHAWGVVGGEPAFIITRNGKSLGAGITPQAAALDAIQSTQRRLKK